MESAATLVSSSGKASFTRNLVRFIKLALFLLVGLSLGLIVLLWAYSPGTAQPVIDDSGEAIPGAISTVEKLTLGGVDQHLIIRAQKPDAPVLLFLHGGPGSPEYPFFRVTNMGLERDFVVVHWEQRGAGKSFSSDISPESMKIDQFIADTAELAHLLVERFGKEKIYLMGHSWGSMLGILAAQAHPELFHAYFGVGQVGYQYDGERISLEWARSRAAKLGDLDAMDALADLDLPASDASADAWLSYLVAQRRWLDELGGGLMHAPTGRTTVLGWMLATPEYTVSDKIGYVRGMLFSIETLWLEVVHSNLIEDLGPLEIPVTFFHGAHDFQTPYPVARALFEAIDAPEKTFYEFESSAHSPPFEEPERFNMLIRKHAGLE